MRKIVIAASLVVISINSSYTSTAQTTTASLSGIIKTTDGSLLQSATIVAIHEPTNTKYQVQSRANGLYHIFNLNPGGPYTIEVSFINFTNQKRSGIFLQLGEDFSTDFILSPTINVLQQVTITATKKQEDFSKSGSFSIIDSNKIKNLPSVGRNIYDYLRAAPQAKLIPGNEGAVSIAGQNNRYNSFYVDGAVNNDVFGLSNSGMNGGQTGATPLSIDAIDQFQMIVSPYDAALGNFTGGSINAITRSGNNKTQGSIYFFYRDQNLAGTTPTGPKSTATKLPDFYFKTYGFRIGGALLKNKLFYFVNAEQQRDISPKPFDLSTYVGNTNNLSQINKLSDYLKNTYHYDAGGFINNEGQLDADRISTKIDWNINSKHKLTLSYRYTKATKYNTYTSSNDVINFYNDGYIFPSTTHSFSLELKSIFKKRSSNKLLITYTSVDDERSVLGKPFPHVVIDDGLGKIVFGPDINSTQNLLIQHNMSLFDTYKFSVGKGIVTMGIDAELNDDKNVFIQNTFGNYNYGSITSFYNNNKPVSFTVGYPLIDNILTTATSASAKFKVLKAALFLTDEINVNKRLILHAGIRADWNQFLTQPATDDYTNDTAIPKFSQYYDLRGAKSGQTPVFPLSLSPRIGFTYKLIHKNISIRGGIGLFTGRVPLVWPAGIYNNNGIYLGGYTASANENSFALNTIRFRADPFHQWRANEVGITLNKGGLNLLASDFRMPKLLRTSVAIDKKFMNGWSISAEAFFSKNINEIYYSNINILPPTQTSPNPGARNIYPTNLLIPISSNGTNPYDNVILLSNNQGDHGYAFQFVFNINKRTSKGFDLNANYSFGRSFAVNDGTSSVNLSQWRYNETVNGRNFLSKTISDFNPGHKIFFYASKKIIYAKKKMSTTFSLVYTGQSGAPFSYVYANSMVRDYANGESNDLIYIPTIAEVQSMALVSNTVGTITYTSQQQKNALEAFIQNDDYLNKHRGQFAERNGATLPFSNIVDLKITQDFNLKINKHAYQFQLSMDIFNFTNLINRNWGRTYYVSNDQFSLMQFVGYSSTTNTPLYRFNPEITHAWNYNNSVTPAYSDRWIAQLGLRFNF